MPYKFIKFGGAMLTAALAAAFLPPAQKEEARMFQLRLLLGSTVSFLRRNWIQFRMRFCFWKGKKITFQKVLAITIRLRTGTRFLWLLEAKKTDHAS